MNTGREPYSYTSVFFLLQVFTAKQCAYPRVSRPLPLLLGVLLISLLAVAAYAQPVRYEISFENAVHHEARITATFSGLGNKPLEAVMSRSSPGRYALHEFAKHVYEVSATSGKGEKLRVERHTPYEWRISGHDGTVKIAYTLFGNRADGTYTGITARFAHLNMPATFIWARGLTERPVEVTFKIPAGKNWRVATQLKPETGDNLFSAPDFQYFMDSPTIIGEYTQRQWTVKDKNQEKTIQLALFHEGETAEADAFAEQLKKIVLEQQAIFGELPDFDFGRYTFLASYSPYVSGDGMEHRNSTILSGSAPLKDAFTGYLGTAAHEFFHAWNVERIRPRSLEPFDFERANMSGELWFAEGFTSYYGDLTLARTGALPVKDYVRNLGNKLNFALSAPGPKLHSAVEMSQQAPFVDAAVAIEPNNRANTYLSYYVIGDMIGVALDLSLRKNFKNLSLDDYMRRVWQKYGKTEVPYTMSDLRSTLAELTNASFADSFFNQYIEGTQQPPYPELLAQAGLLLRRKNPEQASMGTASIRYTSEGAQITSPVLRTSPLYAAGLDSGDIITRINGQKPSEQLINQLATTHKPGETINLEFLQMGRPARTTLTLVADPQLELVMYEDAGMTVTKAMQTFRQQWLGSRVPVK